MKTELREGRHGYTKHRVMQKLATSDIRTPGPTLDSVLETKSSEIMTRNRGKGKREECKEEDGMREKKEEGEKEKGDGEGRVHWE